MPPKKKVNYTRASTEVFLLGQQSAIPNTITKPLTNGDVLRYLHLRKGLEANKSFSWDNLLSCPLTSGTNDASCQTKGCQTEGGEDMCGVAFCKNTGGWIKTGHTA